MKGKVPLWLMVGAFSVMAAYFVLKERSRSERAAQPPASTSEEGRVSSQSRAIVPPEPPARTATAPPPKPAEPQRAAVRIGLPAATTIQTPRGGIPPQGTAAGAAAGTPPGAETLATEPIRFDIFKDAERLTVVDTPANAAGEFRRVSLLRTPMKYPLVRVEETLRKEGHLGEERVLKQVVAVADHVMVKVQPGLAEEAVAELARKHGGRVRKKLTAPDTYLIEVAADDIESLPKAVAQLSADKALVAYAEPDYVVHALVTPNDGSFSQLWGMDNTGQTGGAADADIDAPEAWAITTGSPSVVVGVIDTGIDYNHPDLAANIWTNPGEIAGNGLDDDTNGYVDDVRGWNFVAETNNPADDHFHGTHCAGTIGAVGNNSAGVAGVNWQVKMIPLKFLSASGGGVLSDAVDAVRYATRVGARLTSNSWGGGGFSQTLKDAIDDAGAADSLFVAAAGNDASDNDAYPSYPASYLSANVLSVAATDHADQLAGFSNYGKTSVHLAAPGVGILSTFPTVATAAMTAFGLPTSYARISGTSMATPHVSGVAALALAQTPALTVVQLRSRFMLRSDRLTHLTGIVQTAGRLNAFNVVDPTWQPGPAQPEVTAFALDDSEGNSDGFANPGEILRLTPELSNFGAQAAIGVSVTLVSNQSSAVVLTAGPMNLGNLEPFVSVSLPTPFRVQLDPGLTDNTVLDFDLVVRASGLADLHFPATLVVSKPKPRAEVVVNFACGEMKADPARNLVYLLNKTDRRVLAIDTELGELAAFTSLDGDLSIAPPVENGSLRSGQLAISPDGTHLYVALTGSKKIQSLALPALTPVATFTFDFAPESLACGENGRLYAGSTDYWGTIRQIDPTTGAVLQSFDKGGINGGFYMHSLLRTNPAGTRLFVAETGMRAEGGPGYVYEFDVTGSTATLADRHPYVMTYLKDFAVDEEQQRIYTLCGAPYAIQVTDRLTGEYGTFWPFGSAYPAAIALLPADPVIYGATADPYASEVRRFRRTDGLPLGDYHLTVSTDSVPPRGLVITPNGNLIYIKTRFTSTGHLGGYEYTVGIIGRSSFSVNNPASPPLGPVLALRSVDMNDLEGNNDTVLNPGEIVQLRPTFENTGDGDATDVSVELTTTASGVTVVSPASQPLYVIYPGTSSMPTAPLRLQLGASLADGAIISFTLTARYNGQEKAFPSTLTVRAASSVVEASAPFQIGEILADRQRNTVYLVDKRLWRLLAFDTSAGHFVKSVPLAAPAQINGTFITPGQIAQSIDGSRLFVALGKGKKIQAFSLPDLQLQATWSFNFEPGRLACDAQGRLYTSGAPAFTTVLLQIDTTSGAVLGQTNFPFFNSDVLRQNDEGTRLFSMYSNTLGDFDTTGAGVPSLVRSVYPAGSNANDLAADTANNRLYLGAAGDFLHVMDLATGTIAAWATPDRCIGVAHHASRADVWAATQAASGAAIRRFRRSDGQSLGDVALASGPGAIMPRGIVMTPNGRVFFVRRKSVAGTGSVDNNSYTLGMLSGSVDSDVPAADPVQFKGVVVSDPAPANNDGFINPGELVSVTPTFKNVNETQLAGVTMELISQSARAAVVAPSTRTIGAVNSFAQFTASPPFQVQISPSATDTDELKVVFRVTRTGGAVQEFPYSLCVAQTVQAETLVDFAIGEMAADRTRNLAYVLDQTHQRLLAIDTSTGTVTAGIRLAASVSTGGLALSRDGSRLFVALDSANKIQVINLPQL